MAFARCYIASCNIYHPELFTLHLKQLYSRFQLCSFDLNMGWRAWNCVGRFSRGKEALNSLGLYSKYDRRWLAVSHFRRSCLKDVPLKGKILAVIGKDNLFLASHR